MYCNSQYRIYFIMMRTFIQKRRNRLNVLSLVWLVAVFSSGTSLALENGEFTGLVRGVSQNPVAKVQVYIYDNENIRRPADYISPPTDTSGEFKITLPPGHYWVVARLRQGEQKFGPLFPGDKHSGSPLEIDVMPGEQVEEEFVIADLKETSQLSVKHDTSFIKVEGVLQTKEGEPVENGYVFANRQSAAKKIPDYVGEWTDKSGKFTLFLPEGTYFFAMATTFPPGSETVPSQKITIETNTPNNKIVIQK